MNRFFLLTWAIITLGIPTLSAREPHAEIRHSRAIDGRDLSVTVYAPDGGGDGSAPAVVMVHGGGWTGGNPELLRSAAEEFSARGFVCFVVEYRLAVKGSTTIADSISDIQDWVRWVQGEAGRLGVDPARLTILGESAGGHLAAAAVLFKDGVEVESLVLINPVLNLGALDWISRVPGVTRENAGDLSPIFHLRQGVPRTLIVHGIDDEVVPISQSREFAAAATALGNVVELIELPGVRHAFFIPSYGSEETRLASTAQVLSFLNAAGKGIPKTR